jgi:hypothetical protein
MSGVVRGLHLAMMSPDTTALVYQDMNQETKRLFQECEQSSARQSNRLTIDEILAKV